MFGTRIKELRLSLGLNQVAFASRLCVSVSNWENGNIQPSIDMLVKISRLYSVSADYLLGLDDRHTLDATGLTDDQLSHIQILINDLREK